MRAIAGSGAGFLLAVLWFDLMFDVQARGHPARDVPQDVRSSIATYYARVTTAASPMNLLVAVVMIATIGALCAEVAGNDVPLWRASASLTLTVSAVGLAAGRTVRNAKRLGRQTDDAGQQSRLAHSILRDHIVCLAAVGATLALQLPHA